MLPHWTSEILFLVAFEGSLLQREWIHCPNSGPRDWGTVHYPFSHKLAPDGSEFPMCWAHCSLCVVCLSTCSLLFFIPVRFMGNSYSLLHLEWGSALYKSSSLIHPAPKVAQGHPGRVLSSDVSLSFMLHLINTPVPVWNRLHMTGCGGSRL